ncbi:MAG: hypothetical protein ACP5JP_06050 [bacterium]
MFKLIKYIIILIIIIALILILRVSFKNHALEISLKNPQKIENLEKKTIELKKKFVLIEGHEAQHPTTTVRKEKPTITEQGAREDKGALDRFIKEHSN